MIFRQDPHPIRTLKIRQDPHPLFSDDKHYQDPHPENPTRPAPYNNMLFGTRVRLVKN